MKIGIPLSAFFALLLLIGCGGETVSGHSSEGNGGVGTSTGGSAGGTAASGGAGQAGGAGGTGGTTVDSSPPSCQGLPSNCGHSSSESCCASPLLPGGTYFRSYDNVTAGFTSQAYPATVSAFRLDQYEVTVGRFRKFVAAFSPDMILAGAGKNANDPDDPGWDTSFNTLLPTDSTGLIADLECTNVYQTWTESPGSNENKPVNCLTWYEAFAFCIWDGGRLPTEAEWNYAAAGGEEQRVYPWGGAIPDDGLAVFCGASCAAAQDVGAKSPKGDGKWGHADLAGNVYEWALDWDERPYPQVPCDDCANLVVSKGRAFRGGAFSSDAAGLIVSMRNVAAPWDPTAGTGVRCVRAQ